MRKKIKAFLKSKKEKMNNNIAWAKSETAVAMAVLNDDGGGNKAAEILIGIVIVVVVGILILNTYTGYFSSTFWPMITGKINSMFS